ncbi:hypothetical protein ACFL6N_03055 [Thermodesulfobacteriota bacterium]
MKSNWIKLAEQQPPIKELVLLYNRINEEQHIGWFTGKEFSWGLYDAATLDDGAISHWQHLPDDPVDE